MFINIVNSKRLLEAYKNWVRENPQMVTDFETTFKWTSYILAGRISNSPMMSELMYSLSNLLVLYNDKIIEKTYCVQPLTNGIAYKIKLLLTTLEYCEVFVEISAKKLCGPKGCWIFVVIIQLIKLLGRFFLLQKSTNFMIEVPPISNLNRKHINNDFNEKESSAETFESKFFKLRSGKIIRKISGSPPPNERDFTLPIYLKVGEKGNVLKAAEYLFIAKPILHLGFIGMFGYNSWKSYSMALACDIISIHLYYTNRHSLNQKEKIQLSARCINMLLYLVRSPFYEAQTETRINKFLTSLAKTVPFATSICNPLIQYIPQWQTTYFYMWSS